MCWNGRKNEGEGRSKGRLAAAVGMVVVMGVVGMAGAAVHSPGTWAEVNNKIASANSGDVIDLTSSALISSPPTPNTIVELVDGKNLKFKSDGREINNVCFVLQGNKTTEITIENLKIKSSDNHQSSGFAPLYLNGAGKTTLILEGDNRIESGETGVTSNELGNAICLHNKMELTIKGTGKLFAKGGGKGAGIGTMSVMGNSSEAKINIDGGIIDATGGNGGGAGIGGGFGSGGAGIQITINGGTVKAVGGNNSAGIGGGASGGNGAAVIIDGGSVCATGGAGAEAIGSGDGGTTGFLKNKSWDNVYLTPLYVPIAGDNKAVSNLKYGTVTAYGQTNMKTDENGKLYLYLPVTLADKPEAISAAIGGVSGYSIGAFARTTNNLEKTFICDLAVAKPAITVVGDVVYTGNPVIPSAGVAIEVRLGGELISLSNYDVLGCKSGTECINVSNTSATRPVIVVEGKGHCVGKHESVAGAFAIKKAPGVFDPLSGPLSIPYAANLTLSKVTTLPVGYVWEAPATKLEAGDDQVFKAIYTKSGGNWEPVIGNVVVNVVKVDPSFTRPAARSVTYSPTLRLRDVALPTGFEWANKDMPLDVGSGQYLATFTPTDKINYNEVTVEVVVNVTKANPPYAAPTGLKSVFGRSITSVDLDPDWEWEGTGLVGSVGDRVHTARYTPDDIKNYNIMTNIPLTVKVEKAEKSELKVTDRVILVPKNVTSVQTFDLNSIVLTPANHGIRKYKKVVLSGSISVLEGLPTLGGANNSVLTYRGKGELAGADEVLIDIETDNYEDQTVKLTFQATPKEAAVVSVTPPASIVYGAVLGNPSASARNLAGGALNSTVFTYKYIGDNGKVYDHPRKPEDVGTYRVEADLADGHTTHDGYGVSAEFKITPRELSLSWFSVTGTYTYKAVPQEVTFADGDGVNYGLRKDRDYDVRYESNLDAGTGRVYFKGKGNFSGEVSRTFTIAKKVVTINPEASMVVSKIYDGTTDVKLESIAFDGLEGRQAFVLGEDYTVTGAQFVNAEASSIANKAVTATVSLVPNGPVARNYTLTSSSLSKSDGSITKKYPELGDFLFAIPSDHRANGLERGIGAVALRPDLSNSGVLTVKYNGASALPKNVGSYSVSLNVAGGDGANFSAGEIPLGAYTILPPLKPVIERNLSADVTVRQGNAAVLSVSASSPNSGVLSYKWYRNGVLVSSSGASLSLGGLRQVESPYEIYVWVTNNRNGEIDSAKSVVARVKVLEPAKPLDGAELSVAGGGYIYDGRAKSPEVIVKLGDVTLSAGDYEVEFSNNVNAGTAVVVVNGVDAYSGMVSGTFPIARSRLLRSDLSMTNAKQVYNGAPRRVTVEPTGGRTGLGTMTILYDGARAIPTDAGEYWVTVSVTSGLNFMATEGALEMGIFTVEKKTPELADLVFKLPAEHDRDALAEAIENIALKGAGYGKLAVYFNGSPDLPEAYGDYEVTVAVEGGKNYSRGDIPLGYYTIIDPTAVLEGGRVIRVDDAAAVVAPVVPSVPVLTVGPNPVCKFGTVNFYRSGWRVGDGVLTVYDALGNVVSKVVIAAKSGGGGVVGSWDLTDFAGRSVSEGTYVVRGALVLADGSKERVSLVVVVR